MALRRQGLAEEIDVFLVTELPIADLAGDFAENAESVG
jgi:hypothetical protein